MKAGLIARVLCGLLMVFFLGTSTDEGCDSSSNTSQLIVNNNTSSGFTVTVAGQSGYVDGGGDAISFDVAPDIYYTVTTSTGLSKTVYVGNTSSSVSFP
ncbi:MAG: hypothetical protein HYV36_08335 [Lentisphaerae bacterium]|nr:hypothetical protein [Lentisphaerota bacterium]